MFKTKTNFLKVTDFYELVKVNYHVEPYFYALDLKKVFKDGLIRMSVHTTAFMDVCPLCREKVGCREKSS